MEYRLTMPQKSVTPLPSTSLKWERNLQIKSQTPEKSITDYLRMIGNHTKSIFLLPTEENEIRKIAFELPTKSSSGYDNISNVLLKEIIEDIVEPLSFIFNHSM